MLEKYWKFVSNRVVIIGLLQTSLWKNGSKFINYSFLSKGKEQIIVLLKRYINKKLPSYFKED